MMVKKILSQFPSLSALVVGDICLDRWCTYDPNLSEPSRETGIPRLAVVATEVTPGAGGTVANNLAALRCGRVAVLGVVGDDGFGYELRAALAARGIEGEGLIGAHGFQTFTYTKLLNAGTGEEDRPRVDFINARPLPVEAEEALIATLDKIAGRFDVILVSDQAETDAGGVVTPAVRNAISTIAIRHPEKVLWVDSRLRVEHFRNVIVKPNHREAAEASQRLFGVEDFERLRRAIGPKPLFVTQGAGGVTIWDENGCTAVPARRVDHPVDICGAGDSFSAGAALAYAVTRSPLEAARIGNLVASVTIMKRGTGTASPEEVLAAGGCV